MSLSILLVHSGNETFVRLDQKFLSEHFQVQMLYVPLPFPINLFRYWQGIRKADLLFCWFASWNCLWGIVISKLYNIPSVLVIGGYDVAKDHKANYGHQRGGIKKLLSRLAMKYATNLTSFSYYSRDEAERNANIPSSRIEVIYLGVPDRFSNAELSRKEQMILGVGNIDWVNLKRKGWESFVRAAKHLQEFTFVLVGNCTDGSIDYLKSIAGKNVIFTGRISDDELNRYYQRASYYVQASSHEGFGLSVAEAMLAKCIPIVSQVGSLPEVVGDCGLYLDDCEPETIAKTINNIPENSDLGNRARQRILELFPPEKRIEKLWRLIENSINRQSSI